MVAKFRRDITPSKSRLGYDLSAFGGIDAFTEENSLSPSIGSYGYNIQLRGGVLQNCIGVNMPTYKVGERDITLPSLVPLGDVLKKLHHYRGVGVEGSADKMLAYSYDGKFYKCDLLSESDFTPLEGAPTAVGDVTFINYYTAGRDTALIYHSAGLTTFDNETVTNYENLPYLNSVTMLYERAFGISSAEDKVHFSAPLNPTDFSVEGGGGEITIRDDLGKLIKIISFAGAIYIFKEYGIYRLSVVGAPTDYVLSKVVEVDDKIVAGTIAHTPSGVVLLVGKALKLFDGYNLKELERGLTALIDSAEFSSGCYFDDNYFLSCKLKTEGEKVGDERDITVRCNNGVLVLNLVSGGMGVMRGADIIGFYPVLTSTIKEVFVVYGNGRSHRAGKLTNDGRLYGEPLEKLWRSARTNFKDVYNFKVLKRIALDTRHDLSITVKQGTQEVTRTAYGYNREATVPFNTSGYDFCFELRAEDDLYVRGVKLIFDFIRRYFP